jgi:hypothetical protein
MGQAGTAGGGRALWLGIAAGVLALLWVAPGADADVGFCLPGSGAGQCAGPANFSALRGLGVDHETGRLYVADEGNNRIEVFEEDGDFLFAFGWGVADGASAAPQSCGPEATPPTAECFKGVAGAGRGQFDHPVGVAVDNIAGSTSRHDIYVVDMSNFRVQKFDPNGGFVWTIGGGVNETGGGDLCPVAPSDSCGAGENSEAEGAFSSKIGSRVFVGVGPGGVVHVLDNLNPTDANGHFKPRLQRFEPSGALIPPQCLFLEGGKAKGLAVEAGGSFWVSTDAEGGSEGLRKYDSSCAQTGGPFDPEVFSRPNTLSLDEAGSLFAGAQEARDSGQVPEFQVITAHNAAGAIVSRFGYGRIPARSEGLAAHDGGEGGIFASVGAEGIRRLDFSPPASPTLPPPGPITPPPSIEVKNVGSSKATAVAEINPEGKPTEVHFDYLTEQAFEEQGNSFSGPATKSTPDVLLGAEAFTLKATEGLIGCPNPAAEAGLPGNECLTSQTKYRWQVVATNADGEGEGTVEGPPFETNPSLLIGDTYATEVGTDTAKLHAEVNPLSIPATGFFEYVDDARFEESGFANATKVPDPGAGQAPLDFGEGEEFVTRSVSLYPLAPDTVYHWRIVAEDPLISIAGEAETFKTFTPPESEPCPANEAARIGPGALLPDCRAYELVSPLDKAGGDIRVLNTSFGALSVLEQSADSGEKLAYGSSRAFGDAVSGAYTVQYIARRIAGSEWETHAINPPRGGPVLGPLAQAETEFKIFSADLCEAWLTTFSESPWGGEGAQPQFSDLYRRSDRLCGAEGYVALAPILEPTGFPPSPVGDPRGGFFLELQGVSADGENAIFLSNGRLAEAGSGGPNQLYEKAPGFLPRLVCILPGNVPWGGPCTAGSSGSTGTHRGSSVLGAISADGERIFWSDKLPGEGKLYVRIGGTETVPVSQTAEEEAGTSASWFWGAAADGGKAIFTTGNRLYEFDVDAEDTNLLAEGVSGVMGMSTDVNRIYFVSTKALAAGAAEGKPNLYLHQAGGGGATTFVATLASSDLEGAIGREPGNRTSRVTPDGAHAAFLSSARLGDYDNKGAKSGAPTTEAYRWDANTGELVCASCNPSGARPAGAARIPVFETSMHAARALADDGSRLYFESDDRLLARDSNGQRDVYQWEETGAGGCDEKDANFSAAAEGCIELVSSGQSPQNSRFVEADPSGADVFFATVASLLPQDYGLFDIYDARVGGGLPIPAPPPPPCEGDACANPSAPPEQPTPASSAYASPPEAPSGKPAQKHCPKGKQKVKKKGKSQCAAKHKRNRRGRAPR